MQFTIAVLKPSAPYPPRPDERADWLNVPLTDTNAWAVVALPAGTTTRALRLTFTRGGTGANDDLLADIEDKKGAPSLDLADKPASKKSGFAAADDGLWQRRIEGMKLLGRRFENVFAAEGTFRGRPRWLSVHEVDHDDMGAALKAIHAKEAESVSVR